MSKILTADRAKAAHGALRLMAQTGGGAKCQWGHFLDCVIVFEDDRMDVIVSEIEGGRVVRKESYLTHQEFARAYDLGA